MNYLDIIIVLIVLVGFILGYKDGLVRKIIGLIGFVIAIGLAFELSSSFGSFLTPIFNHDDYLATFVAGVIIFFLTILIFAIFKRIIHPVDKVNRFVNKFLGGISGALQILFFVSGFFLFLNIFKVPSNEDREKSLFYSSVFNVIPWTIDLVLGSNSKINSFLKDNIENNNLIVPNPNDSIEISDTTFIMQ